MNKIVFIVGMCCVFGALAQHAIPNNMETGNNMAGTMDLNTVMKTFDPKLVVVHGMRGEEMSAGVHAALVKSLISDFHQADVPVIYAEKKDIADIQ